MILRQFKEHDGSTNWQLSYKLLLFVLSLKCSYYLYIAFLLRGCNIFVTLTPNHTQIYFLDCEEEHINQNRKHEHSPGGRTWPKNKDYEIKFPIIHKFDSRFGSSSARWKH